MATCIGYSYILPKDEILNLDYLDDALEILYGEGKATWRVAGDSVIFISKTKDLGGLWERLRDLALTRTYPEWWLRTTLEPSEPAAGYKNLWLISHEYFYSPIHTNFYTRIVIMSAPEEPGIVQVVGEPKHFKLETLNHDLEMIHGKGTVSWKLIQAHKVELVSITIETEDVAALVEHFDGLGVEVEWTPKRQ
ncbi:uncharacterized protein FSUBG_7731 [Fusarium subglutinans]|uniref:Uncharacterized protein n=1 Tax=Gibberella subglutinans TaxID=42677 RepID=A0A8H5PT57_GIBSU|nr:uncharacterized protein FSUBG_7731 [Fusarium subglutinans]KAF5602424.1 hypothetical protein FSUBG_7731 [Fusarium subglutinans]